MRAKSGRWVTLFALLISGVLIAGPSAWAEPPTITSEFPPPNPTEDTPYEYVLTVTDPDGGQDFTFGIANKPDFLEFDKETANSARLFSPEGDPPTSDFLGIIYNVTITVKDTQNELTSQSFEMELQPLNDSPQITEGRISLDDATQDVEYVHTFTVEDEENDAVTLDDANSIYPGWLEVNKISQTPQVFEIRGTPDNEIALGEPISIQIELIDGKGGTASLLYTLEVENVNDAPTILDGDIAQDTATQDTEYTHTFQIEDIDNDEVTINLDESSLPDWLIPSKTSDNPQTFQLAGTPLNEDALSSAPENIVVTLDDGNEGGVVTLTYDLDVINVNDPPEFTTGSVPPSQAIQDVEYTHTFTVEDIDGDRVTVQDGSTIPGWLEVPKIADDPQTWQIIGTPDNEVAIGAQPINVNIILGDNFSDTAALEIALTFDLTVQNVNDAPEIVVGDDPQTTIKQDEQYSHTFTVEDIDGNTVVYKEQQSILPEWLTVEEITEDAQGRQRFEVFGTPDNEVAISTDPINVDIRVGDNVAGVEKFDSLAFTLDVQNVNDAPVITEGDTPPTSVTQGNQYSHVLAITDIDEDTVTFKPDESDKPDWMTVAELGNNKFELKGKPQNDDVQMNPPFAVNLVFGDNSPVNEQSVPLTYDLTIQNKNDAPTIAGSPKAITAGEYTQADPYIFQPIVDDIDKFGAQSEWDINNLSYQIFDQPPSRWSSFDTIATEEGVVAQLKLFPSTDDVTERIDLTPQINVLDNKGGQATLNFTVTVVTEDLIQGDFNLDFAADLTDAIIGLQTLAGISVDDMGTDIYVQAETDVNGDLKLGLEDVIYILNHAAAP